VGRRLLCKVRTWRLTAISRLRKCVWLLHRTNRIGLIRTISSKFAAVF
jgi:hypothetical protein